jgi:hypothetical protein
VRFPAIRFEQPSIFLPRGGFTLALAARADAVNHVIPRAEYPFDVPAQNLDVGEVRQRRRRFQWLIRRGRRFGRLALGLVLDLDLVEPPPTNGDGGWLALACCATTAHTQVSSAFSGSLSVVVVSIGSGVDSAFASIGAGGF